ncbi:cysteine peptidase family C39 domain-containing protein, partial [Photobacterium marinum]|uniref:cysteine peptidase family C39 domain-containing protein n=1 Tax=Photobacterium marinum TaxID=1056511 RepID=UPI00055FC8EB
MTHNERLTLSCIQLYLSIITNKEKSIKDNELDDHISFDENIKKLNVKNKVKILKKNSTLKKLDKIKTPAILFDNQGAPFILAKTNKEKCLIQKANKDKVEVLPYDELSSNWNGKWLDIKQSQSRFDIRWFIPEFLKHKRLLSEIFLFSFVLQILALISPLFFQVVMD